MLKIFVPKHLLLMPDAVAGGGGAATETAEPVNLEAALEKMFPDEPGAQTQTSKPPGKKPDGETVDLSQEKTEEDGAAPEGLDKLSAEDKTALDERAKENGVTPEKQFAGEQEETERLNAIAKKTGESFEAIYEREEKDGELTDLEKVPAKTGAKTYTQEEVDSRVEETVKKRLKNATTKIAELERQLEARPVTALDDSLASITSVEKLVDVRNKTAAQLKEARKLIGQLSYAPKRVEQFFEDMAAESPTVAKLFKNGDGLEFSVDRMAEVLEGWADKFQTTLDAIPTRENFLKTFDKAHDVAMKVHPWLENDEDPRTVMFRTIERSAVGRAASTQDPTWEYWIGLAVSGHLALQAQIAKAKKNGGAGGKKFIPRVKFAGTARARGGGARGATTFAAAKAKGDPAAMADALGL